VPGRPLFEGAPAWLPRQAGSPAGSEAGSYLRLIYICITQLSDQGPSRICIAINKEEEEEEEEKEEGSPAADTAARRNPATCRTNLGTRNRRFAHTLRAGDSQRHTAGVPSTQDPPQVAWPSRREATGRMVRQCYTPAAMLHHQPSRVGSNRLLQLP